MKAPNSHASAASEIALRTVWRDWQRARRQVLRGRPSNSAVHELRIAMRRMVALEALLRVPVADDVGGVTARLEPVLRASGRLRDTQVSVEALNRLAPQHAVSGHIAKDLRRGLPRLSRRLKQRLEELDREALKKDFRGLLKDGGLGTARERLRKEQVQLRHKLAGHRVEPDPQALHKLRLQVKAVRYMGDWLAPLVRGTRLPGNGRSLAGVQRSLGTVADARALLEAIDEWAGKSARRQEKVATLRAYLQRLQSRRIAMHMRRIAGSRDGSA
jgi:CHAD domain-containing protein